jgi:hypothetical protein
MRINGLLLLQTMANQTRVTVCVVAGLTYSNNTETRSGVGEKTPSEGTPDTPDQTPGWTDPLVTRVPPPEPEHEAKLRSLATGSAVRPGFSHQALLRGPADSHRKSASCPWSLGRLTLTWKTAGQVVSLSPARQGQRWLGNGSWLFLRQPPDQLEVRLALGAPALAATYLAGRTVRRETGKE